MTAFVYRIFDREENLLYIGCSINPEARIKAHHGRHWWRDVGEISLREYPTRERALKVEARAIRLLTPIWNRQCVRVDVQYRKECEVNAARLAKIKSPETWNRWVRLGCPGIDD